MAERKNYDIGLVNVGKMLTEKRKSLGERYSSREKFINLRSSELFGSDDWISLRHLSNIETGKNWISIEKLLLLATALEENPVDLFEAILRAYHSNS